GLIVLPLCILPAGLAVFALVIPLLGPILGIAWVMLLIAGPFARYTSYYQAACVFGGAEDCDYTTVTDRAGRVGRLWHKQNVVLIWLLSPWPLVFATVALTVILPGLAHLANEFAAGWLRTVVPVMVV